MTATQADLHDQQSVYAAWAKIYDPVYAGVFSAAHRIAAQLAAQTGPRILEVGLGTGLVLGYYPKQCIVTGIDLSLDMLKVAKKKIGGKNVPDVAGLAVMDAARLAFPQAQFDAVVFPFVIALVPSLGAALDEAYRVLKPGGQIVIANRFGAESGPRAWLEALVAPLVSRIGWSCNFKVSRVGAWADARRDVMLDRHQYGQYFKVLALHKIASA